MPTYQPVYFYPDKMPIDISYLFENEKPAGKHGFCKVQGDRFVFEDGTPARFWGVIFNGACCFPEHDYAEKVAGRLAQAGCNIVRFHQLDAEWATPNIYRLTAGKWLQNTRELCEESFERMDYLIKCLKDRGIYIDTDITTYRKYKTGDGVVDAELIGDNVKCISLYDRRMIELQKEYACKFWNHYNPYTGLCYKDDPVFALLVMINENDCFRPTTTPRYPERSKFYDNEFRELFAAWLKEQNIEYDAYGCALYSDDEPMIRFRTELSRRYYEDMYRYLREIGLKMPLTGTNDPRTGGLVKAQERMDYQDGHLYFYDWGWGEEEKWTANVSITSQKDSPLGKVGATRLHGQPMFMTEWDMPWPNSYRAESPIWFPAVACLQGWSGMTIHTYAYGTNLSKTDLLGKEASTSTIGSVPYREGIFTCWNDPSKFGLFYHGALMMRRGDVHEAKKTVGAKITQYGKMVKNLPSAAMEIHRVDALLDTTDASDLTDIRPMEEDFENPTPGRFVSDTGELWRDYRQRVGVVDTPMTKAVYGFPGKIPSAREPSEKETVHLNGLDVHIYTDFGTVALSSLTDEPISESGCILLSAIGRSSNRGCRFDGEKLLDFGTGPIEVEILEVDIRLKTSRKKLRVWSVNSEGCYVGNLPHTCEDGWMCFHLGRHFGASYYLIMDE